MKTQRIYLDTSVVGGCFDDEFEIWSNALIDDIRSGLFHGVTSEVVEAEIADAPKSIREKFIDFLKMKPEILDKIRQFNAVNLEQGYHTLEIYSPREVTSYEKD